MYYSVCLCVYSWGLEVSIGGRVGVGTPSASPRSTIQILICSLPQETGTISPPPPQFELASVLTTADMEQDECRCWQSHG